MKKLALTTVMILTSLSVNAFVIDFELCQKRAQDKKASAEASALTLQKTQLQQCKDELNAEMKDVFEPGEMKVIFAQYSACVKASEQGLRTSMQAIKANFELEMSECSHQDVR